MPEPAGEGEDLVAQVATLIASYQDEEYLDQTECAARVVEFMSAAFAARCLALHPGAGQGYERVDIRCDAPDESVRSGVLDSTGAVADEATSPKEPAKAGDEPAPGCPALTEVDVEAVLMEARPRRYSVDDWRGWAQTVARAIVARLGGKGRGET